MFEILMLLSFAAAGFSQMIHLERQPLIKKARKDKSSRAPMSSKKSAETQFMSALTFSKPRL